jgi:hypothetical protein
MLKACRLWEKTSANNRKYLVGRWGGLRVLILENGERGAAGKADFHLLFAEANPPEDRQ